MRTSEACEVYNSINSIWVHHAVSARYRGQSKFFEGNLVVHNFYVFISGLSNKMVHQMTVGSNDLS